MRIGWMRTTSLIEAFRRGICDTSFKGGGAQPDQVRVLERDTGISTTRSSNLRDSTARSGQISTEREGARGLSTLVITEMLDPGKEIGRVLKGSTSLVLI